MKKLIALVLALAMVATIGIASAITITVERDGTYQSTATGTREFTYYQVFRASMDGNHTDSTTGEHGYDSNGDGQTPLTASGSAAGFAYYLLYSSDSTQIDAMKGSGNIWFDVTDSADHTRANITWKTSVAQTHDNIQAAATWLKTNCSLASGALTWDSDTSKWTSGSADLPVGYYVIESTEGSNLVAATSDINIKEKNSYPTVDKKEKDNADGEYANGPINVKIGDTVYYQVEVKVPSDANQDIVVADTMSTGLTYGGSVTVTVGDTVASAVAISNENDANYVAANKGDTDTWTWKYTIHPTAATKGKYVVFTFTGVVNTDALVSTNRKNDVEIKYNNEHYVMPDTVDFDIGAAAIIKYDGATADLSDQTKTLTAKTGKTIKYLEASFTLTDGTTAINVNGSNGVYTVDPSSNSNIVTSNKDQNGVILIYGLDPDKTYTLTETATEQGYNMLAGTVSLAVTKAEKSTANTTKVTVAEATGVYAGDSNADAANTLELNALQVAKVANNQGAELPSTGGIGTTIFYIVGGMLLVGAAIVLVARRKASN